MQSPTSTPTRQIARKLQHAFGASIVITGALIALLSAPTHASENYPSKPIKVIVPFAPGGPVDVLARVLGEKLLPILNQPLVIENRGGSGGNLGAAAVAKADPDGYTVLITVDSPLTISPGVYPTMPFRPDELMPVMVLGTSGLAVAVHPSMNVKSVKELIAKGKTDVVTFSSAGNGSPGHLAAAMLEKSAAVKVNHIPYKGAAPAVTALLGGEVQAGILAAPGLVTHFKSGRLQPLAVTGPKRSALLPEVPTIAEVGYPDMGLEVFYIAMVPTKTPTAIVKRLQQSLSTVLRQPDVRARLEKIDMEPVGATDQAVTDKITKTKERYAKIIRATGMKAE